MIKKYPRDFLFEELRQGDYFLWCEELHQKISPPDSDESLNAINVDRTSLWAIDDEEHVIPVKVERKVVLP